MSELKATQPKAHNSSDDDDVSNMSGPRSINMDFYSDLNRQTLVPGNAAVGKRGKGAGLYCEACNLTFKDSIQYLDHLNSKQHLYNSTGETDIDKLNSKITVEDVRKRLKYLKKKMEIEAKESGEQFDLNKRIENRKKWEEQQTIKKKQKKKAIQKEKRERLLKKRKREEEGNGNPNIASMMGFAGFGSTKN